MSVSLLCQTTGALNSAVFSPDRAYRYALERRWDVGPFVTWIMLNPSKADEVQDDATIRRCIGYSKRWGAGGALIGNLYALMSTDPARLMEVDDPVGPDTDVWLEVMIMRSSMIVAAWGAHRMAGRRSHEVVKMARSKPLVCLGRTRSGDPMHPVRLPYSVELECWP